MKVLLPCAFGLGNGSMHQITVPNLFESLEKMLGSHPTGDSIFLLGDFNAYVGNGCKTWKSVIGRSGLPDLNLSGVNLLDFCASHQFVHN